MIDPTRRELTKERSLGSFGHLGQGADNERSFLVLGEQFFGGAEIGLLIEEEQKLGLVGTPTLEDPWVDLVPPSVVG